MFTDQEIAAEFEQLSAWDADVDRLFARRFGTLAEAKRQERGSFPTILCRAPGCTVEFTSRKGSKFCSNRCKQADKNWRRKTFTGRTGGKHPPRTVKASAPTVCAMCPATFTQVRRHGRPKVYCSESCSKRAYWQRKVAAA